MSTHAVVNDSGSAGKALAVSEPVLTPSGFRRIGDLTECDLVIGSDGLPYEVLGVYPQGERDLHRVTFSDGTAVLADADHLWEVQIGSADGDGRPRVGPGCAATDYDHLLPQRTGSAPRIRPRVTGSQVLTTAQLRAAGLVARGEGQGVHHRFFVRTCAPVKFEHVNLAVDPYLVGVLLGVGAVDAGNGVRLVSLDTGLVGSVAAVLPEGQTVRSIAGTRGEFRIVSSDASAATLTDGAVGENVAADPPDVVAGRLADAGVCGWQTRRRFVPAAYRLADADARLAVLQGLLDATGDVGEQGVAAEFATTSEQLAEDVQFLAQTLGCVVTRGAGRDSAQPTGQERAGFTSYRLRITAPAGLALFRVPSKLAQVRVGRPVPYRAITSIEAAGRGDAVCIEVASPDRLYLTRNCVLTHNTTTAVSLAALLAERRLDTLLIDNDPQGNATLFAGVEAVPGKTMAEVLVGERSLEEVIVASPVEYLWVAPAMRSLNGAVVALTRDFGGEQRIRVALQALGKRYDAVIIDCPGSASVLTVAGLVAADRVIAVAQPTLKELEGLPALEETITKVASLYNPGLALSAVVPCIVPPASAGTLYVEGLAQLRELYGDLVTPPVRRSVRVPEAYSRRLPLTVYAPLEPASYDYQLVLEELFARRVMP